MTFDPKFTCPSHGPIEDKTALRLAAGIIEAAILTSEYGNTCVHVYMAGMLVALQYFQNAENDESAGVFDITTLLPEAQRLAAILEAEQQAIGTTTH